MIEATEEVSVFVARETAGKRISAKLVPVDVLGVNYHSLYVNESK